MKQKFLDSLHDVFDWMDQRRIYIGIALGVFFLATILLSIPSPPTLDVYAVGPITIAEWSSVEGARAYQIQGRSIDGGWQTLALIWDGTRMTWPSIPGPMKYRVRAWTNDGPQRWSAPTPLIYFLPKPMIPDPDRKKSFATR